jgi:hypothetical protein
MRTWYVSDLETEEYLGILELEDGNYFEVVKTKTRLVFGGSCNTGLLESGYMVIDKDFSIDVNLQDLIADLETYYRDGKRYCIRIICNDRM